MPKVFACHMSLNKQLTQDSTDSQLKKEADETLFLELALRGYDLSKLRDEEPPAEIVKIGVR